MYPNIDVRPNYATWYGILLQICDFPLKVGYSLIENSNSVHAHQLHYSVPGANVRHQMFGYSHSHPLRYHRQGNISNQLLAFAGKSLAEVKGQVITKILLRLTGGTRALTPPLWLIKVAVQKIFSS